MEDCKACEVREEMIQELIRENDKLKKRLALKTSMNIALVGRMREAQNKADEIFTAMCQCDAVSQADGYAGEYECHTTAGKASDSQDGHTSGLPCSTPQP